MTDGPAANDAVANGDDIDPYPLFARYMDEKFENDQRAYREATTDPNYVTQLTATAELYRNTEKFEIGQLVQWKKSMRNRPFPIESAPSVVVDILESPAVVDIDGELLIEPRDLLIGFLDGERIFRLTQVPSARFRSFTP